MSQALLQLTELPVAETVEPGAVVSPLQSGETIASARHFGRIPELDGLRGLAILLVLYTHYIDHSIVASKGTIAYFLLACGRLAWSGVDLFFVLSGFLIGSILLNVQSSSRYFRTFYIRRVCRIVPIYAIACVIFGLIALLPMSGADTALVSTVQGNMPWYSYATYTQNLWMAHRGVFGAAPLSVTWSLCVEEQFYLVLPAVIRFLKSSILVYTLIAAIIAVPFLRIALFLVSKHGYFADYVLAPCRADALFLGVLAAVVFRTPRAWNFLIVRRGVLVRALVILLGGVALLNWKYAGPFAFRMISLGYTWLALLYACTLLLLLSRGDGIFNSIFKSRALRWLGSIAYGTYLIHFGVLGICHALIRGQQPQIRVLPDLLTTLLALGLTLLIAQISWTVFEKPLVKWGHQFEY